MAAACCKRRPYQVSSTERERTVATPNKNLWSWSFRDCSWALHGMFVGFHGDEWQSSMDLIGFHGMLMANGNFIGIEGGSNEVHGD